MKTWLTLLIMVATGAGCSSRAHADEGTTHYKEMHLFLLKHLNLSSDQQKKVDALGAKFHPVLEQKRASMMATHVELAKMLVGDAASEQVNAKFAALQKSQDDFGQERFAYVLAVRALLTSEQKMKFGELMKEHLAHVTAGSEN